MYQIAVNARIEKEIKKFGKVDQKRVYLAISQLKSDPRPKGKKIKPFFGIKHGYRLRVGTIRVLYMVLDKEKKVLIIDAGYRGDIY